MNLNVMSRISERSEEYENESSTHKSNQKLNSLYLTKLRLSSLSNVKSSDAKNNEFNYITSTESSKEYNRLSTPTTKSKTKDQNQSMKE